MCSSAAIVCEIMNDCKAMCVASIRNHCYRQRQELLPTTKKTAGREGKKEGVNGDSGPESGEETFLLTK